MDKVQKKKIFSAMHILFVQISASVMYILLVQISDFFFCVVVYTTCVDLYTDKLTKQDYNLTYTRSLILPLKVIRRVFLTRECDIVGPSAAAMSSALWRAVPR